MLPLGNIIRKHGVSFILGLGLCSHQIQSVSRSDDHCSHQIQSTSRSDDHCSHQIQSVSRSDDHCSHQIQSVSRSDDHCSHQIQSVSRSDDHCSHQIQSVSRSDDHCSHQIQSVSRSDDHCSHQIQSVSRSDDHCSHQIQSVSRSDGGSSLRDELYSSERQRSLGHLDEPQRQISREPCHLDIHREKPLDPVEPLQSDFAAVGTNYWFVWPEGNCPPRLSLVSPKVFSPFCHRWSFGSLPLSPLACSVGDTSFPAMSPTWLHRYYLNWTEMPLTQKCSYFDIVQLLWHNLYC